MILGVPVPNVLFAILPFTRLNPECFSSIASRGWMLIINATGAGRSFSDFGPKIHYLHWEFVIFLSTSSKIPGY
jgi:hypothetical protein